MPHQTHQSSAMGVLDSQSSGEVIDLTMSDGAPTPPPTRLGRALRVVLTGGPGGVKTAAGPVLQALLVSDPCLNFPQVYVMPEAATLLYAVGIDRKADLGDKASLLAFQKAISLLHISLKDISSATMLQIRE